MTKQLEAKFYAVGVLDTDGCCERVSDDEAQFWTVYERQQGGTSQAICDCDSRQGADAAAGRFNELIAGLELAQKQSDSWKRIAQTNISERENDIAALDAARRRIEKLDRRNSEINSTLERWSVERAQSADRIAELEASPLAVKLPEALIKAVSFYEQVKSENPPVETGAWKDATEWVLKEAIRAAGGTVEGE